MGCSLFPPFIENAEVEIILSNILLVPIPLKAEILLLLVRDGCVCRFISDAGSQLFKAILSDDGHPEGLSPSEVVDIVEGVENVSLEVVVRLVDDGVDKLPEPSPLSKPLSRLALLDDDA